MARSRRDYGTGSVYQRCDEVLGCPPLTTSEPDPETGQTRRIRPEHRCKGPWKGVIVVGTTERGTLRRRSVTAPTEAQAKIRLRKLIADLADGATEASARTTVKQWSETWLPLVERTLRPQPYVNTRSSVTKWIVPTIGHRRLSELAPADVRAVTTAQRKAGLTSSSQRRTHSVLMSMLKAARAEGYAVPAIAVEVKAPAASVSDRTDLPVEAAVAMLGVAAEIPQGSRWVAAFLQGLRQGEALGLTWDEVDLDRGRLRVSWQLQPLAYRIPRDKASGFRVPDGYECVQLEGRWHLVRPKSKAGWRVIPLVPWMRTSLQAWREASWASPHGLVWPALDGGPCDPKVDDAEWYALQATAGVVHPAGRPFTVHEARHTTATLLLEAGVDPAVITAILGHTSILTSRGYMHVNTAPLEDALGRVAGRLGAGVSNALHADQE